MDIVIVDDSVTNLIVLKHLAASGGANSVITFSKPEEARDFLLSNPVDLIIVDFEMPKLGGLEFLRQVRGFAQHAATPVLMVTSHSDDQTKFDSLQAGATEFLSKPVNSREFKIRVRNLMQLKSASIDNAR